MKGNLYRIPTETIVFGTHEGHASAMAEAIVKHPWGQRVKITMGKPELIKEDVSDPQEAARAATRELMAQRLAQHVEERQEADSDG